ncbi:MAG TPA: DinB family protein [Flavisolibacter sp.]|nr:DinB family protein [Flavisolibacter sp.]
MKQQLIEAWNTGNKINLMLVANTSADGLQKTLSTRGGRTVAEQLLHMHSVRMQWLETSAKELFNNYRSNGKDAGADATALSARFTESGKAIEQFIGESWDNGGKVSGFRKGLIPFIAYLLSHEAHHRGNILLTLKQSGIKLPDALKWGIWEWNKV